MKGLRNQLCNGKRMLPLLISSVVLFSCSKDDVLEPSQMDGADSQLSVNGANASSSNLVLGATSTANTIFAEDFEGSDPWYPNYDLKERFFGSHSFTQVSSPVISGAKSGRFELRNTDELSSGTRAEVRFPEVTSSELHRWYSYSIYFPSADYKFDSEDEVLAQWHQGSGYSPSISLRTKEDRMWLYVKPTTSTTEKIDLGAIQKDKWNTLVYHIKHSSGSDGILELWINGTKKVSRTGANMYKIEGTIEYPRFNIGIYKSAWNGDNTSDVSKRVLFYDNFRLASENANYAEMTSGTSGSTTTEPVTTEPVPTTEPISTSSSAITSFTLVDASTEKDVMTVANGGTINLANLSSTKLNIRANAPSTAGSVKFELSGAQSKTYTDNAFPYSLHGDSGGNYYYGNWNPPALGTYTLKATPLNGSPYSITFTIINSTTATAPVVTEPIVTEPVSTSSSAITGFTLVDASTEKDVMTIANGGTISLSKLSGTKLNIRANTGSSLSSVKFELSGAQSKTYTDGGAPFALHGDSGTGNYYYGNWNPPALGTYTLKATPYSGTTAGAAYSISFTVINSTTTATEPVPTTEPVVTEPVSTSSSAITGFTLVDASTEKDVMTIANGGTISLSKLSGTKLNIRANTGSSLSSVKFELSGAQSKTYTDGGAPFALHGDSGTGNYYYGNWNPPALGTYTLKATPFSGTTAGAAYSISFTITN